MGGSPRRPAVRSTRRTSAWRIRLARGDGDGRCNRKLVIYLCCELSSSNDPGRTWHQSLPTSHRVGWKKMRAGTIKKRCFYEALQLINIVALVEGVPRRCSSSCGDLSKQA